MYGTGWVVLFLLLSCLLVSAKEIKFEPCGGDVRMVTVEPCNEEPCNIPRGSSVNITGFCRSNAEAQKLRLTVWADLSGIEVPYPGMKRDACKGKGLSCPIHDEQYFSYVQVFEVKKFFPKIETKAKFLLKTNDDRDKVVCCFIAPVKVV